jgi:hypothetical protein
LELTPVIIIINATHSIAQTLHRVDTMGLDDCLASHQKHITIFMTQHRCDHDNDDDGPPICSQFKDQHTMGMPLSSITEQTAALLMHPTVPKPVQEWWWQSVQLRDILVKSGITNTLHPEDVSAVCRKLSELGSMCSHRDGRNKHFCIALPGHVPKEQFGITAPSAANWTHKSKDLVASQCFTGKQSISTKCDNLPIVDDHATSSPDAATSPNTATSPNAATSPLDKPVSKANNNARNHHQHPKEPPSADESPIGFADHVRQGHMANNNWLRGKLEKSLFDHHKCCSRRLESDLEIARLSAHGSGNIEFCSSTGCGCKFDCFTCQWVRTTTTVLSRRKHSRTQPALNVELVKAIKLEGPALQQGRGVFQRAGIQMMSRKCMEEAAEKVDEVLLKQVREQIDMNCRRTAEAARNSPGFVAENNILVWHDHETGERHETVKISASVDATGPTQACGGRITGSQSASSVAATCTGLLIGAKVD